MTAAGLACDGVRVVYPGARARRGHANARAETLALDGVTLHVRPGSWTVLLGANGSGKSTLLGVLTGAVRATGGHVSACEPARMGVVFQTPALDGLLTVRENLQIAAALYGVRGRAAGERIERVARAAGVGERLEDRVARLSGGLARRADLARALVHEPGVLVLDEATVGLDPAARREFLELVRRERADRGGTGNRAGPAMTVLAATHLLDEAADADRVVMLAGGRVVADGSPAALCAELGKRVARVRPPGEAERVVPGGLADDAVRELVAAGAWVGQGRATLEDVYFARAGAGL